MSYNKVKWFSLPFVAPKGKGSKPEPARGEIREIDPPEDQLPSRPWDDPLRLTPQQRRERIVELLAIAFRRLVTERRNIPKKP